MPGEEIQPELLIPLLFAMWACTVGPMFCCLAIFFGHWKPDLRLWIRRAGHMLIFSAVLVIGSQSQTTPAQAQQDATTRRVERLEDQATSFTAVDADLKAIVAQQKDMLAQLIATNAKQDERIGANADALQKIAVAAETIKETQDNFANRVTWVGGVLTTVVILAGFFLDRLREKRMRNGHSPFAEPFAQLEKKMAEGRSETNDLLRQLIEAQPKRRQR